MNLENVNWGEFFIEDIFDVKIGKNVDGNKVDKLNGKSAYITRKESNNGLDGLIDFNEDLLNKDFPVITIGNETAEPFVQNFSFFTGTKVNILKPKKPINYFALSFISTSLKAHKQKYSYSFTINSTRLKKQKILLPITPKGNPDYKFMETYIQEIEMKKTREYNNFIISRLNALSKTKKTENLELKDWKEFSLINIFNEIQRGKRLKKDNHINGLIPYASSTALNNGIDGFIGNTENIRIFKNCLTLANSGSVGATFYHPYNVIASDHVTKLQNKNFNKYVYLFLATMVSRLNEKYSFNREINDMRIKKEKVFLPINKKGNPDYQYMEDYMKYLEYQKLKEYLEFKK